MQEREQQAHRDRLEIVRLELAHGVAQRRLVERAEHVAAEIDALLTSPVWLGGTSGSGLSYMTSKIAVP